MVAKHAVVVGAGLGGLAAAARLAHHGWRVDVYERQGSVGGRMGEYVCDGFRFDTGPTLVLMREPLERLFTDLNESLDSWLDLRLVEPSYLVHFGDGSRIYSSSCVARMVREITALSGADAVPGYLRLLADISRMHHEAIPLFVRRHYRSWRDLMGIREVRTLLRHRLLAPMYARVGRYMRDHRLRQLFTFQSMYLGLSPIEAPWVYATLTYMECGEGVWYPIGGMYRIADAIRQMAVSRGACIHTQAAVRRVMHTDGRVTGIELESGDQVGCDTVLLNADVVPAMQSLLGVPVRRRYRNSCSALVYLAGYDGHLDLPHHALFFSKDFQRNLHQLFVDGSVPEDPSFYTCISARTDPNDAPQGCDNLFVLAPVPHRGQTDADGEADRVWAHIESRLATAGYRPERLRFRRSMGLSHWQSLGLWDGAAFGLAHNFLQSTVFRPSCRGPHRGSWFVGASTAPGNGIPMVLISAELAFQQIIAS